MIQQTTPTAPAQEQPAISVQGQGLPKPDDDPLAKKMCEWVAATRKHWDKLHKRIEHNRKVVAGLNWKQDPKTKEFADPRANLIFSTAQATLPNIYARNPDVSVTGAWRNSDNTRLFCDTLQTVLSRQMRDAQLKKRMKMSVLGAMTEYFGIVKITYQRDIRTDPLILQRINDTQDNIEHLDGLLQTLEDPDQRADAELTQRELQVTLQGLQSQSEVVAAEGIVLDRVLPENLLIDAAVIEFDDYEHAGRMAQVVPMKRGAAQAKYGFDLSGAKTYRAPQQMGDGSESGTSGGLLSAAGTALSGSSGAEDEIICILEIWDRESQMVYTMAEGTSFFCRDPFAVQMSGQRWYSFFILPFAVLPGQFVTPCLVDLTEKLQDEHNETRDKFAAHREMNKPGYVASSDTPAKSLKRHTDSVLGEVVLVDTDGKPLNQVIIPKQNVPVNPTDYDTSPIRYDWEQVTGLQDAARSVMVQPKTATEASIMQQSLSGRTAEFRDKQEDLLTEMFQFTAQILLQELTPPQVEKYTGPNVPGQSPAYDWPQLSRDDIFNMVDVSIVGGTTGAPDKQASQEIWTQVFPLMQQLITQIMQLNVQGVDYTPLAALLRETLRRFDDQIDADQFLPAPKAPVASPIPGAPAMPGQSAAPMPPAGQAPMMPPIMPAGMMSVPVPQIPIPT